LFFVGISNIEVVNVSIMLNKRAHQNPFTKKPSTNLDAMIMINALITNKKSPKVKKVIGIVNTTKIGLSIEFNIANTIATSNAVINPSTLTPGNKYADITTANEDTMIFKRNFINNNSKAWSIKFYASNKFFYRLSNFIWYINSVEICFLSGA